MKFVPLPRWQSGLEVKGEIRSITTINKGKEKYLLFTVNNSKPVWYQIPVKQQP
jgi:hypothetical protein